MKEMMMFSERFLEQDSFEIEYKGKKINAFYCFDKKGSYVLRFTFISSASLYPQGIIFHLISFQGELFIDGKEVKKAKGRFPQLLFDEANSPQQFDVKVVLEEGYITICNGSNSLDAPEIWHSLSRGCAMIIKELEQNHFRFYCNDHENDDDFDDLIFELEIIKLEE